MPTETKQRLVFLLMAGTGAWLGFLCGVEVISYDALAGFFVLTLVVFLVWAVWITDPKELREESLARCRLNRRPPP